MLLSSLNSSSLNTKARPREGDSLARRRATSTKKIVAVDPATNGRGHTPRRRRRSGPAWIRPPWRREGAPPCARRIRPAGRTIRRAEADARGSRAGATAARRRRVGRAPPLFLSPPPRRARPLAAQPPASAARRPPRRLSCSLPQPPAPARCRSRPLPQIRIHRGAGLGGRRAALGTTSSAAPPPPHRASSGALATGPPTRTRPPSSDAAQGLLRSATGV